MKVLDLACADGHRFEGWFASEEDFLDQNGRQAIACPVCASHIVVRRPSAPRIAVHREATSRSGGGGVPSVVPAASAPPSDPPSADDARAATRVALQSQFLRAVRHVMENTEDVGPRFAEEARRIHYGEAEQRGIWGEANAAEIRDLVDEGIECHPLPVLPGDRN